MADTSIAITAGSGTSIDTRTEATNGNHRQVVVIGDPTTNAGVALVDATAGLKVDLGSDNDVTVTSGNITVGGSGKTPLTIWLAGMLRTKGRKPAIIARGYGSCPSGLNDELQLAMRKCPYAAVLANPDRTSAIRDAITELRRELK